LASVPRTFVDTNVLLAALLTEGTARQVVSYAIAGGFVPIVSEQVLSELERNLHKKFKVSKPRVVETVAFVRSLAEVVATPKNAPSVCRDNDDDAIIAAAIASNATYLLTGDRDLLEIKDPGDLQIVSPRNLLHLLAEKTR
jgi:putative PIN family toxin of toxin-antitoxin system